MTDKRHNKILRRLRWSWFPSLHFGDGTLLSVLILSAIMLRRFGQNNAQTAFYIALLCLPLVLRPLLETVVTYFRGTTKVWILSAEFVSALSLWALAFTLPTAYWLQGTLCFMPFVVMSGVFYNIAAERFYTDRTAAAPRHQTLLARLFGAAAMLFGFGVMAMIGGNMEVLTRNVRYSWSVVFYVMAGVEFFLWLWHSIFLPGGQHPYAGEKDLFGMHRGEYDKVVSGMLRGWRNRFMVYFFLLAVMPEAFLSIMSVLFVIDAPHNGGLGLSPQELALSQGTVGVAAFFLGRAAGSSLMPRHGLRRWLVPAAVVASLHGLSLLYLSFNLSSSLPAVCAVLLAGNFAFGFSSSACAAVMRRFAAASRGFALRRAVVMSLMSSMLVLFGMSAGLVQMNIGYRQFFALVSLMYIATVLMCILYAFFMKKDSECIGSQEDI